MAREGGTRRFIPALAVVFVVLAAAGGWLVWHNIQESAKQRNAERQQDLAAWHLALTAIKTQQGVFPANENTTEFTSLAISNPQLRPPKEQERYVYLTSPDRQAFVMCSKLEMPKSGRAQFVTGSGTFEDEAQRCGTLPAQVATFATTTTMTDAGRERFFEVNAELKDKTEIRHLCRETSDTKVAVYGCYTGNNIYVLDIDDPGLQNEEFVVAAHELLHAAYRHLTPEEKPAIDALLDAQTKQSGFEVLAEELELYTAEERPDELHSRLGTEYSGLLPELEQYYQRYFTNRAVVVGLHANFGKLTGQIRKLRRELDSLEKEAERYKANGDIDAYNEIVGPFNRKVAEINRLIERYNGLTESPQ